MQFWLKNDHFWPLSEPPLQPGGVETMLTTTEQYWRLFKPSLEGQNYFPSRQGTLKWTKNDNF